MGTCESEENPAFRTVDSISRQNSNFYQRKESDVTSNYTNGNYKTNYNTIDHDGGVYKISRRKIKPQKIVNFNDFNNIPIQDNNTNYSVSSKSRTETSDNYVICEANLDKFSRVRTLDSMKSSSSSSVFQTNTFRSKNSNNIDYKKNVNEKKRYLRRIHSSDKALEILTEENLKKLNSNHTEEHHNNIHNYFHNNNFLDNKNEIEFAISNDIDFKCIKTIHAHKEKISCATELHNNHSFATGSYDNTIKIWNMQSNLNNDKTIKEEGNVLCILEFEENMLLSGTSKNNINLWNLMNLQLFYTFKGHKSWVNNLTKINNRYFASCSNDHNVLIWDYHNKVCVKTLQGHADGVLSVIALSDGKLCSGGADLSIKIWDSLSGKCCLTLLGHKKWIKCLYQLNNNYILSGSDDKTIKMWENDKCLHTFLGHARSVRTLCQINDYFFASGSFDKTIKIWDIYNYNCVHTILGHNDLILIIIKMKSGEIISCSSDHEIKLWISN